MLLIIKEQCLGMVPALLSRSARAGSVAEVQFAVEADALRVSRATPFSGGRYDDDDAQ
jgi:hypothetical protein